MPLKPGENLLAGERGESLDIWAEFDVGDAATVGLAVRGTEVVYDSSKRTLTCNDRSAPLAAEGGRIRLRILADRTSLEIFGDDGMIYMPIAVLPREGKTPLAVFARGGTATIHTLDVHELSSIWPSTQAAATQAEDAATPIDVGRQLFVDDHLIGETTLTRTFHRARLHEKNPVLAPETPTEMCVLDRGSIPVAAPFDDGVFYDPNDRLFKMWYHGGWFDGNCYAVSKDGLSWERPALDVAPGTNRVLPVRHNPGGGRLLRDGTTVWLDQEAIDPAQRFKMFVYSRRLTDDKSQGGQLFTSADGIHWGEPQRVPGFGYGDNSSFFRDPFRNQWVFSIRRTGKSPVSGKSVRVRSYLASRDFLEFTRARDDQVVDWLAADDRDKPDPAPDLGYEPQLYKVGAVAYESLMVGLFGIFYGPPNDVCDREKRPKIIDLEVGFSRDGRHYQRPDRRAFVACSRAPGTWNRGYLHAAGGICLVVGDELWFYFGAWSGVSPKLGAHMYAGGSTGLAVLRRDGFASLDAGDTPGTLTTKPVTFKGRFPFVNVDARAGDLKVEVLDVEGRVIAPFSLANCRPVTADGTRQPITWEGAADLAALAGKPVRFRFHLSHGELYSFWVSPDASGASYGYVAAGGPGFTGPTDTVGGSDR